MLGEGLRELHARIRGTLMPFNLLGPGKRLFAFLVRHQAGIGGGRRLGVLRIAVRRVLVFGRGVRVLMTLEQRFGQQVVGGSGIRIVRERFQVIAIPARGFLVILLAFALLRGRVKVRRDILQVDLQLLHDLRILRFFASLPER